MIPQEYPTEKIKTSPKPQKPIVLGVPSLEM
jgi:hypothetical protein